MGMADTKLQDAKSATQRKLYPAGKQEIRASKWAGEQLRFITSEGYRSRTKHRGWNGGTLLATREELKVYAGRKVIDPRGWGRFVVTELRGANGNTVAIVQGYMPTRSLASGTWQRQLTYMQG